MKRIIGFLKNDYQNALFCVILGMKGEKDRVNKW